MDDTFFHLHIEFCTIHHSHLHVLNFPAILSKVDVKTRIARAKNFLARSLDVWATVGYDNEYGGYFEALDFDANPLPDIHKRFRIHPRNIFAHAAGTILGYADTVSVAEKAFQFIINSCWTPSGGFVSTTARNGTVIDPRIKTYEHAFVMLGLGWLYKATGTSLYRQWLDYVWEQVFIKKLRQADGKSFKVCATSMKGPARQQNPHMHLLESMLSLYELLNEEYWLEQARTLYSLFDTYFVRKEEKRLREFFNDDWTPDAKRGDSIEPGHHFEWTWILRKYEKLTGTIVPMIPHLFEFAAGDGSDKDGFGYDESNINGIPVRKTHRMWIQTEVIKANITMYEREKSPRYLEHAHKAFDQLFEYYLIEDTGIWYDQLDEQLHIVSENAPASTLYHVIIALDEYIRIVTAAENNIVHTDIEH